MKTNISAVLAGSATLFALTVEAAESKGKDSDAKPAVVEHNVIASLSTHGPTQSKAFVPRVSILDKPIKLKIEVVPLIDSERRPSEVVVEWRK